MENWTTQEKIAILERNIKAYDDRAKREMECGNDFWMRANMDFADDYRALLIKLKSE